MYKASHAGATSIVKGVAASKPSLGGNHHRPDCLPKVVAKATGYGSAGLGSHSPEVAGQHEPAGSEPKRQHHNYASAGLSSDETSLKKVLGK